MYIDVMKEDSYYQKNKEKRKEYQREYYQKNKEDRNIYRKEWGKGIGMEKEKIAHKKYYNSSKGMIMLKKAQDKWKSNNPHLHRWRSLLHSTLLKLNQPKNDTTHNLLKYTAIELNEHLLSLGYNKDIQDIDHRIPTSWFRDDTPPHIVNHLSNLHPLNKKDNIIKGNRFAHPVEEAYYHEVFPFIKNMYKQRIYYVLQKE